MGFLAGGVVLAGVGGLLGGLPAHTERIDAVWTSATVAADGSAQVVEQVDWDFGLSTDKHGIYRDIPDVPSDMPFTVDSDAPHQVTLGVSDEGGPRYYIGDANTTVSGEHRYVIRYDLPGVVRDRVLDWETYGNRWKFDVSEAEVHLVTPFVLDDAACYVGTPAAPRSCDGDMTEVEPGHLVVRREDVKAGEGISVEGRQGAALAAAPTVPEPPTARPEDDGTGLAPPALAAAGGAALAAFPMSRLVRRAGRERVSAGGAADVAYGGTSPQDAPATSSGPAAPPPQYASWPTAAGPYPPPPPPGAAPVDARPAAPVDSPPRPLPPPPAGPPRAGALGGVLARRAHPPVAPPPAVGRIGEPIAGPPQWLPDGDLRIDEAELAELATIEFAPPAELTPAQGGVVLTENVQANHKAAWLVQAAIAGDVDIQQEGQKATGLVRLGPGSPETASFLDTAFRGRSQLSLESYDKDFSTAWTAVGNRLSAWRRTSGLWDPQGDRRRVRWAVFGALAFVPGVLMVLGGAFAANAWGSWALPIVLAGGLVGGAALAVVVRSWELRMRSPAGSGLWLRVESFRRFLAGSEAYHAEEAARRGVLREYTAWALALGEIDRWRVAVMSATTIPPDTPGLAYVWLGSSIIASTSAAATAPSSSSSGGGSFGGGSIGGGAGGGGGGSW
jgi:hypothetical protein